jgi:type 2 lantibiotic biosynthesis protein LanM
MSNQALQMTVNQAAIVQIFVQASSLSERLNNSFFKPDNTQSSQKQADKRLTHWCQVVAQGDWKKFQQRLQWDELNIDTVCPTLGNLIVEDIQTLPLWVETLKEIIQTASELAGENKLADSTKIPIEHENPLPFEDLLVPAILVARKKLLICLGYSSLFQHDLPLQLISEEAYLSLERSLIQMLSNLCSKTLDLEFSHFRPFGQTLLKVLEKETKSHAYYDAFVQELLQDGLLSFFQKYSVLGRLMATKVDLWVEATAEFLSRLEEDLPEIQKLFQQKRQSSFTAEEEELSNSNSRITKVTKITPALSDSHNRGRSVMALTFESGLKLIYKPKNLTSEVSYNQFLDWCNQRGVLLPFKVLKILNRGTHGWVEYVEQLSCQDEAAVQRFYQQAGMLLCVLYVLEGTDCHYENLIASGEYPVLIDVETLMHHDARIFVGSSEKTNASTEANQKFLDSVLRTGLLPYWQLKKGKIAYDVSGLGNLNYQKTSQRKLVWKFINTDDMHLGYDEIPVSIPQNVPTLNGAELSPNNYLDCLVEGFKQMYSFLIKQKEVLINENTPLTSFQSQPVRFIFRDTQIYFTVLEKTLSPDCLQNGVDRSIELDILSRAFLVAENKPFAWSILHTELKAMEALDIPYFEASSDSDTLIFNDIGKSIEHFFKKPSYEKVIWRLRNLNKTDLAQQVALIQGAFYAKVAQTPQIKQASDPIALKCESTDFSQINLLTREQLLQKAEVIAQEIKARAILGANDSANWIALSHISEVERYQLQVIGDNLYDGNLGIAIFLSSLAHVTGSIQYRNLALGALQSAREALQTANIEYIRRFIRNTGIGGGVGLGSIIYSLVKISFLIQEESLLEDAQLAADLITSEIISTDRKLDLMYGTSGTLLGLLTLYDQTGDQKVLDKAILCGQHLLKNQISIDNYPKAWQTLEEKPLTGFAHGAAGIIYALLRLYDITQDKAYLKAACEGIEYERFVFSKEQNNQPSFGFEGFVAWCHGSPGIGLARLGSLSILKTDEILQEIESAIQTTQKYGLQGVDFLCCGNFGRIELLLVAAQKLSRLDLLETARKQATWLVDRAEKTGGYQLFPNLPNHEFSVFSPSFFRGTAGIGYQLLRLAYPEVIPSVLLWE